MNRTHRNILGIVLCGLAWLSAPALAAIQMQPVEYKDGETVLQGYFAYDDAVQGKRPGILIVHEWKGVGDYTKKRAEQLASLGYAAFAADMYGKGIYAKDHEEAGKLAGAFREDRELTRRRAKAALDALRSRPEVDPEKVAAIGYCFGGMTVLEMARAGFDLKGVVSFHGTLTTPSPAKPEEVKAKILVHHGAEDPYVKPADVAAFIGEMNAAGADWQLTEHGGAVHSFTVTEAGSDKSAGAAYNPAADRRSWKSMINFFEEIF